MTEGVARRLFFALWPTADVHAGWQGLFDAAAQQPSVPPQRRHLTLAYLGEMSTAQESAAREVAQSIECEEFSFILDCYGCFEKQRVVWMGCAHYCNVLQCLVSQLREGLSMRNLPAETRSFTPHVTLLRKHREVPQGWKSPHITWQASEFVLVHSHRRPEGLCYDIIGRWPLTGARP